MSKWRPWAPWRSDMCDFGREVRKMKESMEEINKGVGVDEDKKVENEVEISTSPLQGKICLNKAISFFIAVGILLVIMLVIDIQEKSQKLGAMIDGPFVVSPAIEKTKGTIDQGITIWVSGFHWQGHHQIFLFQGDCRAKLFFKKFKTVEILSAAGETVVFGLRRVECEIMSCPETTRKFRIKVGESYNLDYDSRFPPINIQVLSINEEEVSIQLSTYFYNEVH